MVRWNTWEEARAANLTGTDAAALAGPPHRIACSYKTELQVWLHKAGYATPFRGDPQRLRMGNELEPVAARLYAEDFERGLVALGDVPGESFRLPRPESIGFKLASEDGRVRVLLADKHCPFAGTPDYLIRPAMTAPAPGWGVLEVKTAGLNMLGKWQAGPPLGHKIQCMWYCGLVGARWGAVVGLIGGQHLFHYEFPVVKAEIDWLRAKAMKWWRRYVEGNEVPPTCPADLQTVRDLYTEHAGGRVTLPPEFQAVYDAQMVNRALHHQLELEYDASRARVLMAMGEAQEARIEGSGHGWTYYTDDNGTRTLRRKAWRT